MNKNFLETRTIYRTNAGSHTYGTNISTSDHDEKAIVLLPIEYHFGLHKFESANFSTSDNDKSNTKDDVDLTIYSLRKFILLAMAGNPNVLEMLFVQDEDVLCRTVIADILVNHRDMFLSKAIKNSFGGFARQNQKKIEKGLQQRPDMINKYGYDTKSLMHAVRLYDTGIEIFQTGTFTTYRSNADYLIEIRNGKYTKEEGLELLKDYDQKFGEEEKRSELPEIPDREAIEEILISLTNHGLQLGWQ